jgi:hypothetical protein
MKLLLLIIIIVYSTSLDNIIYYITYMEDGRIMFKSNKICAVFMRVKGRRQVNIVYKKHNKSIVQFKKSDMYNDKP